ncbi:MAG: acyl-CoA thioesterase [Pikeienuella sp.]
MTFHIKEKVLFKHCDPAGIVFYPRYFEMINDWVEALFEHLGNPFHVLLRDGGVPTARIDATFPAASRHGETLEVALTCKRLGRSSLDLTIIASCNDQDRLIANATLVHVDQTGASSPWPAPLRTALAAQIEGAQ